ncbi:putative protein kinase RLK-Pelle-SD-2b family [Helianthus anomalus]
MSRVNHKRMILTASQLFFYLFFIPGLSSAADTLSLSGNQTLVSLNGNFEMGFFRPGVSPNYYIGIWYNTRFTSETVVWVANRDSPVSDSFTSKLKIIDGNLVLLDESNSLVWSTNMNSTATAVSATLLDDGNLVLRYGSGSSLPIWQSFDHPTDTLLPGMKLGYNKHTNTNQILTSWRNREDPGMGLFSLELDQNNKQYQIKWNRSIVYSTSGPWNDSAKHFSSVPEIWLDEIFNFSFSYVDKENVSYFTFSLYNSSIISRFIIDFSGQIQLLSSLISPEDWRCSKNDWNLGSFSSGCVRKTEVNCSITIEKPTFLLSYVEESFLSAFLENEAQLLDESACRCSCLHDCICNAYTFISSKCQHWNREKLNKISLGLVSNDSYLEKSEFHIKVASKDLPHLTENSCKYNKDANLGAVVGSIAVVVFVLCVILFMIRRRKTMILVGKTTMEGSLVAFVYRDLQIATKNFTDKLGGGSFGSVFKGVLHDSTVVAVKKLESVSQGEKEFRSEVGTLGIIQHVNLVRKIADFGMSKLMGRDFSRVLTTMRGTRGYLAPEWLSGVAVTAKADVFSY